MYQFAFYNVFTGKAGRLKSHAETHKKTVERIRKVSSEPRINREKHLAQRVKIKRIKREADRLHNEYREDKRTHYRLPNTRATRILMRLFRPIEIIVSGDTRTVWLQLYAPRNRYPYRNSKIKRNNRWS